MASVTYNQQCFLIDGRRVWILGASLQYARIHPSQWAQRIAAARQAGFNTIETACPWMVHEPRKGKFHFEDDADLNKFLALCHQAGMRAILRVGPFVGGHFDAGGFPAWLIEMPGVALRESSEAYLEHVSRYFRRLLSEVVPLQVTNGGPVLLVQAEHAWECANDEQAEEYLADVTRFIRENGVTVPIINANGLWQETLDTIDTWRGWSEMLVHLRQLRSVHPGAPRLVSSFDVAQPGIWGGGAPGGRESRTPQQILAHLAEILAAGAQPVISPFHGGSNFGFLAGRLAGADGGFVTTTVAPEAPLAEDGSRGEHYHAIRRLITFANHFGHVFAEIDAEDSPVVLDTGAIALEGKSKNGKGAAANVHRGAAVVPLRGPQGRIVFVFADESSRSTTLLLEDGVRMPVNLGDMPVGWFVLDVDLNGGGRLDYSNLVPWAIISRSIIVFHGPEKAAGYLSIDGTPLEFTVPSGGTREKPLVIEHGNLTVVICNQAQIDTAYHDDQHVYVGVNGFSADGQPVLASGMKSWRISSGAKVEELHPHGGRGAPRSADYRSVKPAHWEVVDLTPHTTGQSPRYASLEGPSTLVDCGAMQGYGWYRLKMPRAAGRKHLCHIPQAADRAHLYTGGKLVRIIGTGPGARTGAFELKLDKDDPILVALLDNAGRFAEGNLIGQPKGLCGHVYAVREIRSPKPKIASARPVNPFDLRGFISGRTSGQLSDGKQAVWTIAHPRKTPLLIEVDGASQTGTFVLNDQPVAYYSGSTGGLYEAMLIDAEHKALKRGKNVLRFAPDSRASDAAEEVMNKTTVYECEESLTESAQWAFAKWELPVTSAYDPAPEAEMKNHKGAPCWWRGEVDVEALAPGDHAPPSPPPAWWLDVSGLTKGQAFVNGRNLGRYFTATANGQAVGPQTRLYVPEAWIRAGQTNEIVLFDEHGAAPLRVRLLRGIA